MLGDTSRDRSIHYYGSDTHKYINRMIESSRKMYIVSPYIDAYYADFVARRSPSTEFYIISSAMEDDARKKLSQGVSRLALLPWIALSCVLAYIEMDLGISGYPLALSLLPLLWGMDRYLSRSRSVKGVHLKIPGRFVHAKMYISDEQAISGSVNLTYKGTHSNVEHIEISKDPEEIVILQDQFWDLWKRY
jgi:phosphatidylserine/phosphatidylglycerophosphate/cardiolipin synthase-like enzyme